MAIITTDIHGDPAIARAFLDLRPTERHICLGDLVDSRQKKCLEEEAECLDLLLESDAILLWGNHDLAYIPERPWKCYGKFGNFAFQQYEAARDRFFAAYAVDGWLCTHAGVSPKLSRIIPAEVIAAGNERIAGWLNDQFAQQIENPSHGPLFNVPVCRGGGDEWGGIFWFDSFGEQTQPSPLVGPQIFGHSPVPYPERGTSFDLTGGPAVKWINLNTLEGHWAYDTLKDEMLVLVADTG